METSSDCGKEINGSGVSLRGFYSQVLLLNGQIGPSNGRGFLLLCVSVLVVGVGGRSRKYYPT